MIAKIQLTSFFSLISTLVLTLFLFPFIFFLTLIKQPLLDFKIKSRSNAQQIIDHQKLIQNKIRLVKYTKKLNQTILICRHKYHYLNHSLNNIELSHKIAMLAKNSNLTVNTFHPDDSTNLYRTFTISCKGSYQSLLTFIQLLVFDSLSSRIVTAKLKNNDFVITLEILNA